MRRFWKSRKGSASVFLMILVAPLFIFHAVLIDFVRIRVAEQESEATLKAALRSTLSAFEPRLKTYGLYALGMDEAAANGLFREMVNRNLNAQSQQNVFSFIRPVPEPDSMKLTSLYTLGNQTVFHQQLLEEMKIRAPAEFTLSVLDKWLGRNSSAALTSASTFEKHAEQIEEWMVRREEAMDDARVIFAQLHEKSSIYHAYYAVRLSELDRLASQIGMHDVADIERSISDLRNQSEQIMRSLMTQQATLQELAAAVKENLDRITQIQNSILALQTSFSAITAQIDQWQTMLRAIAEYTILLEASSRETTRDAGVLAGFLQSIEGKLDEAQSYDAQIRTLASAPGTAAYMSPELLAKTVLPEATYAVYRIEASSVPALFNGFAAAVQATTPFVGENRWSPERYGILSASNSAYAERADRASRKLEEEQEKRQQVFEAARKQKSEQLNRMNEVLDQVKKLVAECGGAASGSDLYKKLEKEVGDSYSGGLAGKYEQVNRIDGMEPVSTGSGLLNDAAQARSGSFHLMDSLLQTLAGAAQSFRDEFYVNEYALEKFNYRTYGKEMTNDGQPIRSTAMTDPAQHSLANQEAEYVLYGQSSCLLNQSSAYGEMFAFRLAIRTTEALLSQGSQAASVGSPLLMLLWAAAEGAIQAYKDMTDLVNGKQVPVSNKLAGNAVTMNYKDYLRLFYMLHSRNKPTMARMQALIELNTGLDLTRRPTYVQGSVQVSERLWFLPFFESLFVYEVKRNRVYLDQTAFLSY